MLKHAHNPLHFSLYIIPCHFKRLFFAPFFISIQNPAMKKMITIKINNSSSQWDCLSSDVCINGAVTPGDDKKKRIQLILHRFLTECNYFINVFSVGC